VRKPHFLFRFHTPTSLYSTTCADGVGCHPLLKVEMSSTHELCYLLLKVVLFVIQVQTLGYVLDMDKVTCPAPWNFLHVLHRVRQGLRKLGTAPEPHTRARTWVSADYLDGLLRQTV